MGVFKAFGKKASSAYHFGKKAGHSVYMGAKRASHHAAKLGRPIADLATIGASVASSVGLPELAVPLIGVAKGAGRISHYGDTVHRGITDIEDGVKGLQRAGKKHSKQTPFEQPAQPASQSTKIVKFESSPAPAHTTSHGHGHRR